jgi:hypothetical protein
MNEAQPTSKVRPKKWLFGCLWLFVSFCLLNLAWCYYNPNNRFPPAALSALRSDPEAVFYSIDPWPEPESGDPTLRFHGHKIVGQTRLLNQADRDTIVDHIQSATHGAWVHSACFDPRHAFSAHGPDGIYDFLLCFQCGQARVIHPDGSYKWVDLNGNSHFLNDYLTAHGVALPSR